MSLDSREVEEFHVVRERPFENDLVVLLKGVVEILENSVCLVNENMRFEVNEFVLGVSIPDEV